jgi:hypothetical protein
MNSEEGAEGTHVIKDEAYKTDELELGAFLMARGCRVEHSQLRADGIRSEFTFAGPDAFALVKEFEMGSENTLVSVHKFRHALNHLRDSCNRLKKKGAARS